MKRGNKVVVFGPSGSGKSTFGRQIAAAWGLPHFELDAIFHNKPDWNDATREEFREAVSAHLVANPGGWVFDGNYDAVADLLMAEADLAVWIRLPFRVVYPRLVRRTFRRAVKKELLWGTNYERWKDVLGRESMFVWGITNWKPHHEKTRTKLRNAPLSVRIVVLRSTKDVTRFLKEAAESP